MARLLFSIDGIEYRFVSEHPNPTDPGDDAIIDNVSPPLTYSDYYLVVSGTMSRTGRRPARSDPPNVVLKIARNDSDVEFLALEHHTYAQKLASLQGTWIPRYHGFYANESVRGTEQHWRPPACILMDYCGLSMTALSDQDRPLRDTEFDMQLVGAVEALHDLGFVHGNLNADHVLNHDGRPKLVGFTHLTQETCARKLPVVRGAIHPTFAAFNCSELYHLCVDMDVWRPRFVHFDGETYPVDWILDVRKLAAKASGDPVRALARAYEAIETYLRRWDPESWGIDLKELHQRHFGGSWPDRKLQPSS